MTFALKLVAAIVLIESPFVLSQANISTTSSKPASATSTKTSGDCRPESRINSKGELEFTDCSGKTEREDRSKFDAPATSSTPQIPDPATRAKQQEALQAQYDYQAFSYYHAKRTFDFQYWSGKIIFWVVLLIVFAGLAFSAVQFYVGLRHPLEAKATKDGTGKDAPQTSSDDASVSEFEASLQGIKLKSSVLGLLILAMSMVFFYLYLKFVYPISTVN